MKFGLISTVLAAMMLLQGCSDTVDGSSVAAYKKSVEKMSKNMMPTQQRQLAQDMLLASETVQKMNVGTKVFAGFNEEYLIEAMAKDLDGKSVADIQKMAEKRRVKNREMAIETATVELAKSEESLAKETALRDELQKITFGEASVSEVIVPRHSGYQDRRPMKHWAYQVSVKNGSNFTVKGIKFRDLPGNHVSSVNGVIPSSFDEPLKPGEQKVLAVYALIDEDIPEANLRVPPLETKGVEFEMIPGGNPGGYKLEKSDESIVMIGLTRKVDELKRQLAELRSQKAQ
jgi:hypothetical protein